MAAKSKNKSNLLRPSGVGRERLTLYGVVFVVLFGMVGYLAVNSGRAATAPVASVDPADAAQTDAVGVDGGDAPSVASCPAQAFTPVTGPSGGAYWLNPDRYGGGTMCPQNTDGKTDFVVVSGGNPKPNNGRVQAFPNIIDGCTTSNCISGSGFPKKVSSIGSDFRTSLSAGSGNASGEWDLAYDLWFNRTNSVGPSKGTEILIMLNHQNKGFPAGVSKTKVTVDGADWWFLHYDQTSGTGSNKRTWHFVEFRRVTPTNSTDGLKFTPFLTKAESAGQLDTSWYITGVDTGWEIWGGGLGVKINSLSVSGL